MQCGPTLIAVTIRLSVSLRSGLSNLSDGDTAGAAAAGANIAGSNNTVLGTNAGNNVGPASTVICIGANVPDENSNGSCYIGGIFGSTASGGIGVFVNSLGKLGTVVSSCRFKDDIRPMAEASAAIFSLNSVTFRYKQEIDPAATEQFGLIVDEVEKVNPDLVARDKDGKPYSVRYDQVNAMLLNEFLKEHATVQDLKKEIAALKVVFSR